MESVSGPQPHIIAYFPGDSVCTFGSLILLRHRSPQAKTQRETYSSSFSARRNAPWSRRSISTREQPLLLLYGIFGAEIPQLRHRRRATGGELPSCSHGRCSRMRFALLGGCNSLSRGVKCYGQCAGKKRPASRLMKGHRDTRAWTSSWEGCSTSGSGSAGTP